MKLISDQTVYNKPVIKILLVIIILLLALDISRTSPVRLLILVVPAVFLAMSPWGVVDKVWDKGESLLLRKNGIEEEISLLEIADIKYSPWPYWQAVQLTFRRETKFGRTVVFFPNGIGNVWQGGRY